MRGEGIREPLEAVPNRQIVPQEAVPLVGQCPDLLLDALFHLSKEFLVKVNNNLCPAQGDDKGQEEKCIEGRHGSRLVCRRVEYFLP